MKGALLVLTAALCGVARAETPLPSAPGTLWKYQMVQEFGVGIRPSDASNKVGADGKVRLPVTIYVGGTEKVGGVETVRYETHRQSVISFIEFLAVTDGGVTAIARAGEDNKKYKLDPPQKILSFPMRAGEKWNYKGKAGDTETEQSYEIVGQESVTVPAGKFDAFHLRLTQLSPTPPKVIEDRWFVPNVGYAKILTEVTQGDGRLLQRIDLQLSEGPKIGEKPAVTSKPTQKKLLGAALARELIGEPTTSFTTDLEKIYARWQGEELKKGDKVRCAWIAEDVGNAAPKEYKVDEASLTANGPRAFGTFTLTKPNKGWPVGKYRAEFYVGDQLAETIKFTVDEPGAKGAPEPASSVEPKAEKPAAGQVTAEEGKQFADELAAEDAEAGALSIPRADGALIVSLRSDEGKNITEIPEGTKKIFLHSELKGTESTTLKVIYNGPGAGPDGMTKLGESSVHLAKNKPTEDAQINPSGGGFAPGKYKVEVFLQDEKVGAIPFQVTPAANKP